MLHRHLKNYFIPHVGNNYHPHILHTKRAIFYSGVFLAMKGIVFLFVLMLPAVVFVLPDVLAEEQQRIIQFSNDLREKKGLSILKEVAPLNVSADFKAKDMADRQYFDHVGPGGKGLEYFLGKSGYKYETAGENLAMGFSAASDVLSAWVKSPTHYANLIDTDFAEFGVSLEGGLYDGVATVYVVQHFGTPKEVASGKLQVVAASGLDPAQDGAVQQVETVPDKQEEVIKLVMVPLEEKINDPEIHNIKEEVSAPVEIVEPIKLKESPRIVSEESFVFWQEFGNSTKIMPRIKIVGEVASADLYVNQHVIKLELGANGMYGGNFLAPEPVQKFFDPILVPSVRILGADGSDITQAVRWDRIKIVAPTPIQKYVRAKKGLSSITNIFNVSRNIFLIFASFFSVALALSIFVEIKKQHHHITAQTLALILLLVSLAAA